MYCCGTFTNIGAVGSLVAVMQFGEQAIAMASLYRLCEEMFYFGVAVPVSRSFGSDSGSTRSRRFRLDPVLIAIVTALALGLFLNLAGGASSRGARHGVHRGHDRRHRGFLLSIGMGLRLSRMSMYVRESAVISLIKFAFVPSSSPRWPPWPVSATWTAAFPSR